MQEYVQNIMIMRIYSKHDHEESLQGLVTSWCQAHAGIHHHST